MPRPSNETYLAYSAAMLRKMKEERRTGLSVLEADTASQLKNYWQDVPSENKAMPGTQEKPDAALSALVP